MHVQIPNVVSSDAPVPEHVFGYIAFAAGAGVSRLEAYGSSVADVDSLHAKKATTTQARRAVEGMGLTILSESPLGVAAYGPKEAWETITGGKVETLERAMRDDRGEKRYVTHLDVVGNSQPEIHGVGKPDSSSSGIDVVVLNRPCFPHAVVPSPVPPNSSKFHLRLPHDVQIGLNAGGAHQQGFRGQEVVVAMVDTGQFNHPYSVSHGYRVERTVTVFPNTRADRDPVGHGTGESANIFAIAPSAVLKPYRATNDNGGFQPVAGFLMAKQDRPQILTNSWGGDSSFPPPSPDVDPADLPFIHEVQDAIREGIVVVFSAGNGHFSVEPQIPGVLSAGGVFMNGGMELRASNYASGYDSPWFGGVRVPIVCGLVGMLNRAQYLMLPVQPRCELDREESLFDAGEPGDGTTDRDGWALFSGTSAAAPQLAGAAAVLLSARPGLTPAQVIEALKETATDVITRRCHPRFDNSAGVGNDNATGHGLVNVTAAAQHAVQNF